MSEHTPGLWRLEPGDSVIVVKVNDSHIASVGSVPYWKQFTAEDEANARLIAAAPDMLAALQRLLDWNEGIAAGRGNHYPREHADIARAAINKAKGDQ